MKQPYWDLYTLAGNKKPLWFDEEGVPRWVPFERSLTNNIYCDEVALIEIACQACGKRYKVAKSWNRFEVYHYKTPLPPLSERVPELYWDDAPCFQADDDSTPYQCAGSTMTSEPIRVVEFWQRDKCEWKRRTDLEVPLVN